MCGCTGIRSCLVCEQTVKNHGKGKDNTVVAHLPGEVWQYCPVCRKAWSKTDLQQHPVTCESHKGNSLDFHGIEILENFISSQEEMDIVRKIDMWDWKASQSGRQKQDFGPKVNFKKRKLRSDCFTGLPPFSKVLVGKMNLVPCLATFRPIEQCHLEYIPERGSSIDPHFDDWWVWGERLVTLNLLSSSYIIFTYNPTEEENNDSLQQLPAVSVPMPQRSLLVVYGDARFKWMHSVPRNAITSRRIAITYRELSEQFSEGGENFEVGKKVLEIAETYQGKVVK